MDTEVVTEIPEVLKKLVRLIVRGFYTLEHTIVIDLLVRNPCMKEDDIIDLLKFDRKQLRSLISILKNDKFLKSRMRIETDVDGKNTRHNYYFINYQVFVNMVKYRLDHMRRKIEMEERDNTSRASFKCLNCEKTFTDLEADQLFDFMTGTFLCTYCKTEVVEDESSVSTTDARTLLMKYNEQIQPVYDLLRDCEDIKLAPSLLEPEPTDLKHIRPDKAVSHKERSGWSGEATKNTTFGYAERTVTVSVGEAVSLNKDSTQAKETPIWMKESTVEGASAYIINDAPDNSNQASLSNIGSPNANEDIMKTLLAHERKSAHKVRIPGTSDDGTSTSESEDESKKPTTANQNQTEPTTVEEASDDNDDVPMVTVGDRTIPYNDVTNDDIALMTQDEKDSYIQIGQDYYASMYE